MSFSFQSVGGSPSASSRSQGHANRRPAQSPALNALGAVFLSLFAVTAPAGPGRAQAPQLLVGPDALPSVREVPVLARVGPELRISGSGHYAFTEEVLADGDRHHRAGLALAGGWQLHPALAAAFQLNGRYDAHSGDTTPADHGVLMHSRFRVRAQSTLEPDLRVGTQLGLLVPAAATVAAAVKGLGLEADALFGITRWPVLLSARVGVRVDRGFEAARHQGDLAQADRLALGTSQAPELRLGLSCLAPLTMLSLVGEWSWDVPVGGDALPPMQAPMWFRGGARVALGEAVAVGAMAGVNASRRSVPEPQGPLVRLEPRLWAELTVSGRIGTGMRVATETPSQPPTFSVPVRITGYRGRPVEDAAVGADDLECITGQDGRCTLEGFPPGRAVIAVGAEGYSIAQRPVTLPRPMAERGEPIEFALESEPIVLRGRVRAQDGSPLPEARVSVMRGDRQLDGWTDATGAFSIAGLSPGEVVIRVEADQLGVTETPLLLVPGAPPLELTARPPMNVGQIRGTIRMLDGAPLPATVRIDPGNITAHSDEAGEFKVDVAPGRYAVRIEAPGQRSQTREVQVEPNGVTVLLIDMGTPR